jgi:hypothetical protein
MAEKREPDLGVEVLAWNADTKKWDIVRIEQRLNTKYWVTRTRLSYPIDHYKLWTPLPDNPVT